MGRTSIVSAAVLGLVSWSGEARAQGFGSGGTWPAPNYRLGREADTALAVVGAGLVLSPLAVNAVYIAQGRRSPLGWRVAGGVVGGVLCAMGAVSLAASPDRTGRIGAAVALALGAADLGLAVWSGALPERVAVHPAVPFDARGGLAPGVGVTLRAF